MAIGIDTFDLSMTSPETGRYLTANVYTIAGVKNADGSLRQLSIGQLVMAICLQRAYLLEEGVLEGGKRTKGIIPLMEEMNTTSAQLADLTKIEKAVLDDFQNNTSGHGFMFDSVTVSSSTSAVQLLRELGILNSTQRSVRNDGAQSDYDIEYEAFITAIESQMDEKNTFSQQKMIELQSLTNKRDQAYDMISNVLKSLNTTMIGNVNNM